MRINFQHEDPNVEMVQSQLDSAYTKVSVVCTDGHSVSL